MHSRSLKDIDAQIKAIREKMGFATDRTDRRYLLLALQLLIAERIRRIKEDVK